jgi:CRP-like cAMP-binding protein
MAEGCLCEQLAGRDVPLSSVCIGHLWLFENLPEDTVEILAHSAIRKKFTRGQPVFMQGDPAHEMFLIKAGRVMLKKITEDGTEITLDIRKGGDFLGENMLSEEVDYPLTARCVETTLICGFDRKGFENLVLAHPKIGWQVIKNLSRRVAWLTSRVGSMSITNLEDRLYQVLVQVAREHGVKTQKGFEIQFPLTHEELSFLAGAHRVSITRAMKTLRECGKLIQEGRSLILLSGSLPS